MRLSGHPDPNNLKILVGDQVERGQEVGLQRFTQGRFVNPVFQKAHISVDRQFKFFCLALDANDVYIVKPYGFDLVQITNAFGIRCLIGDADI